MQECWDNLNKSDYTLGYTKIEKLDFLIQAWSDAACGKTLWKECFDDWAESREEIQKIYIYQQERTIKKKSLFEHQSKTCLDFVLKDSQWKPDCIIELGGGCGHNIIRLNERLSQDEKMTYINAEYMEEGRKLGRTLFRDFEILNGKNIFFDYYNPLNLLEDIKGDIKDQKVSIITIASIEQIPYMRYEFFALLRKISELSEECTVTFCEPVTWQYQEMLEDNIKRINFRNGIRASHNTNLWPMLQSLATEGTVKICKIAPSLFRQSDGGLDLSGIQITLNSEDMNN